MSIYERGSDFQTGNPFELTQKGKTHTHTNGVPKQPDIETITVAFVGIRMLKGYEA